MLIREMCMILAVLVIAAMLVALAWGPDEPGDQR